MRKPGAFRRYRYREDLFPSLLFRVAYDELREDCPETSDRQYLKILQWAAQTSEQRVERVLHQLLEQGPENPGKAGARGTPRAHRGKRAMAGGD